MQHKINIYFWLALIGATMTWAGCEDIKVGEEETDAGIEEEEEEETTDGGTEIVDETDGGTEIVEEDAGTEMVEADAGTEMVDVDAGTEMEEIDAGMEEMDAGPADDCTAAEAGEEMTDTDNSSLKCAPQEDADRCFNGDYDWEEGCANETCVTTGELCFRHHDSLGFNECLEADSITSNCADVPASHTQDADSAVIYSIAYVSTDSANTATFVADVYYDGTGDPTASLYTERLRLYSNGAPGNTYAVPTWAAGTATGHYTLEFTLGSTAANGEYAIYFDVDSAKSNAYCFTNADMPVDAWTHANNNNLGDIYEEDESCDDASDTADAGM